MNGLNINHHMSIKCDNCKLFFAFHYENLYYPNEKNGISGICPSCYDYINSKLYQQLDLDKLIIIKKKALRLYQQKKKGI